MRFPSAVTAALVVLLVMSVPGAVAATALPSAPAVSDPSTDGLQSQLSPLTNGGVYPATSSSQSVPDAADPAQVIRINVTASGDAEWTIESRFLLTDEDDVDRFLEYAAEVQSGEREAVYDRDLFEPHVQAARESTGREMTIENASWDEPRLESPDDADLEDDAQIGVLSYSFTWTNFATVEDSRIHFGDAFQTADGRWFSTLVDDQRLVIQSPSNYGFDDYNLPVSPEDGALILDGPYQFSEDELEVVFLRGAVGGPGGGGFSLSAMGWLLGGILLVLLVGTASYVLARQSSDFELRTALPIDRLPWIETKRPSESEREMGSGSDSGLDSDSIESTAKRSRSAPEADPDPISEGSGQEFAYAEESDPDVGAGAGGAGPVDPDLLSDEERVLRLLRGNGGRMKQASIVKETGWSNAKVSQLLSKMDDDDEIEKLRIGRENLITLPEVDPTEID